MEQYKISSKSRPILFFESFMHNTTDFCAIKNYCGNKWPKLSELHTKLFGTDFEEAHDASADIKATTLCVL